MTSIAIRKPKRYRAPDFSEEEISIIRQAFIQHNRTLSTKHGSDSTQRAKERIYALIIQQVNAVGVTERSLQSVKDKWQSLKKIVKDKVTPVLLEKNYDLSNVVGVDLLDDPDIVSRLEEGERDILSVMPPEQLIGYRTNGHVTESYDHAMDTLYLSSDHQNTPVPTSLYVNTKRSRTLEEPGPSHLDSPVPSRVKTEMYSPQPEVANALPNFAEHRISHKTVILPKTIVLPKRKCFDNERKRSKSMYVSDLTPPIVTKPAPIVPVHTDTIDTEPNIPENLSKPHPVKPVEPEPELEEAVLEENMNDMDVMTASDYYKRMVQIQSEKLDLMKQEFELKKWYMMQKIAILREQQQ